MKTYNNGGVTATATSCHNKKTSSKPTASVTITAPAHADPFDDIPGDHETELLSIALHFEPAARAVVARRNGLRRSDFIDSVAGCLFGALDAVINGDRHLSTATIRATLAEFAKLPDNDRQLCNNATELLDGLTTSNPPSLSMTAAKARALELARLVELQRNDTPPKKGTAKENAAPTANANGANALTPRILTGHTAAALLALQLPEPKFAVEGIIPEGVTLLAGPPKIGKSWLTYGVSIAVATGGLALGSIGVEQGEALYLALEDNTRRLQSRLQKILSAERTTPKGLENLHLFTEWERINEGGLARLESWMEEHPNTRLIVIDTLEKIRPQRKGGGSVYGEDYGACEELKSFSDRYGVAVVIVHHIRKGTGDDAVEAVSGSYGLTGGVDGVITLKRDRGRGDASLFVTGRDVTEQDLALKWDAELCLWSILGDADEYRMSGQRANVANALRESGEPLTPKQVAERTGMKPENARQFLYQMRKAGQVIEANGKYSPSVSGVSNVTTVSAVSAVSGELPDMPEHRIKAHSNDYADSEAYARPNTSVLH